MAIVRTGESEYDKEMAKWDKPYRYEPFPKMVYRAYKGPDTNGQITVFSVDGVHDKKTTRIVNNERELVAAQSEGWHTDPQDAYNAMQLRDQEHSDNAAVVNYEVSKMSKKAQKDFAVQAAATDKHLVK